MSKKPEQLATICRNDAMLKQLGQHARQLNQLNIVLQNALPIQFANHCQLANVTSEKIIVHTDNASYASMLRFQGPQLCKTLSAHLPHTLNKLEVKVRPVISTSPSKTHSHITMSRDVASLLNNTAASIEEGPLKQALHKLARRQSEI